MNKEISKHFSELGKKGGKASWEVMRKKIIENSKAKVEKIKNQNENNK